MSKKKQAQQKTTPEMVPIRNGYGEGLMELGKINPKVIVTCADLTESTRSEAFAKAYPDRFIEIGVAEQNMVGVACGLALEGFTVFTSSYAVFSPGRSWDQIRVSGCYNNVNLKIAGSHAGISVGPDGATHQALEDIAITRVLPNMTVVVPCDFHEARKATIAIAYRQGPGYLRLARAATPMITDVDTPFTIGKAYTMREGTDVAIIGAGSVLYDALQAAHALEKEGISCMVVNCHTIKPIDRKAITAAAKTCDAVVTVEEHQINGGIGSAIIEVIAETYPVPIERVGMRDTFGESGEPRELIKKYGMDDTAIIMAVRKVMKRKHKKL